MENRLISPVVSVVVPTYNRARLLDEAIGSVLSQTYQDYEIIVVDNYSSDDTEQVMASCPDRRARYMKFRNNGVIAASRNVGIRESSGRYVAFLDSDDQWLPQKLAAQVKFLEEHPDIGLVYAYSELFGDKSAASGPVPSPVYVRTGWIFNDLLKYNFIGTLTVLVRRECLNQVGLFDESPSLRTAEDYELWLRVARRYQVGFVDRVLARYRVHSGNLSPDFTASMRLCLRVVEAIDRKIGLTPAQKRMALSSVYHRLAGKHVLSRDYVNALRDVKALQRHHESLAAMSCHLALANGLGPLVRTILLGAQRLRNLVRI